MERWSVFVLVALLVLGTVPVGGVGSAGNGSGEVRQVPGSDLTADDIKMRAGIAADGDANWTVAYRIRLSDENETAAFESLQEDIRANESAYVGPFAAGINATVAAAENRTGRTMRASGFDVTTDVEYVPRKYGVVTYEFDWSSFAVPDGERIRAGDALAGLFLDSATRLEVAGPPGYALLEVSPRDPAEVGSNSVVWNGPLDFSPGEPTLVFGPEPATGSGNGGTSGGTDSLLPLLGTVLVAAVVAALVALALYRRQGTSEQAAGETAASEQSADEGSEPSPSEGTTAGGASGDGSEGAAAAPDDELLSNEERVERLLEREGGRVKQQEIVSGLDWTEAKTSQVVNAMQEEGRIEKFRIGRENVVKLPDTDDESE